MQATAFHLDLKTSHYRRDYLERLFPRLAAAGYTHVVFEFEDKIRLESTAGAEWHEAWSKDEFAGILASARAAGLTPVPLIQTIGHLEFLLSHARYHGLRELPGTAYQLCPSKPESLAFLKRWLDEVLELFGKPPFIHLGADETYYLGKCPACAARVRETSKSALYLEHLKCLADHVLSRGTRPMAWADMMLAHPEALDHVSRDLVWVDWDYSTGDGTPERVLAWHVGSFTAGEARDYLAKNPHVPFGRFWLDDAGPLRPWPYTDFLMERGFDVWLAPAVRSHGDTCFVPRLSHLPNVVGAAARLGRSPAPAGLLVTSWALRLHTVEAQWPALLIPQVVKATGGSTFEGIRGPLSAAWLGTPAPQVFDAWKLAGELIPSLHSYLGVDANVFYYGAMDRLDLLVKTWTASGFPGWYGVSAKDAADRVEAAMEGYRTAGRMLGAFKQSAPGLEFWHFAARAQEAKARELLLAVATGEGRSDPVAASGLLLEMESLRDEYRGMLSRIYTPGSVARELDMIFSSGLRFLASAARAGA